MTPVSSMAVEYSVRGCFVADPLHPPVPPVGAVAIETKDHTGRVIAYQWVIPEHADELLDRSTWEWLDMHDPVGAKLILGKLRLLKP